MTFDHRLAARTLVGELVKSEAIAARRPEAVARELALWCEGLGRPPTGRELEAWLEDQSGVTEVFATTKLLDAYAARVLTPMPEPVPEPAPTTIAVSQTDARHPELERGIHEALDNADQYLVYADWLQEQGDPFGELIVLGVAVTTSDSVEDRVRFHQYLNSHHERILGTNARELAECFALEWRYGFVHTVRCSSHQRPTHRTWEQLLTLRACELVRSVTFHQITSAVDGVIDLATPHLESVVVLDGEGLPKRLARRDLRSLELVGGSVQLRAASLSPALHRLALVGCEVEVSDLKRLEVRELELWIDPPTRALVGSVQLPHLERLVLKNVDAQFPELLERAVIPELAHLTLEGVVTGESLRALAKRPLAKRLRSLTIARLVLGDADLIELAEHPGSLTALTLLDVSANELTTNGLTAAARLAPTVVSAHQNPRGSHARARLVDFAGDRLDAAEDLIASANWIAAGIDRTVRWARYRGSSAEYELYVTADRERYACNCPSRRYPCKHIVALVIRGDRGELGEAASNGLVDRILAHG